MAGVPGRPVRDHAALVVGQGAFTRGLRVSLLIAALAVLVTTAATLLRSADRTGNVSA